MSRLIITEMEIKGIPCLVCGIQEDGKIVELRPQKRGESSMLGNIYVGQVENVSANIGAAFVLLTPGERAYLPLKNTEGRICVSPTRSDRPIKPGDQILVQVCRDAMKGKLAALSTGLDFTGKYLVLTTKQRGISVSSKLSSKERERLRLCAEEFCKEDAGYGLILRTNAAQASMEELKRELSFLQEKNERACLHGASRTVFSCVHRSEPEYLAVVRDIRADSLEEIVTDLPDVRERLSEYLEGSSDASKLRFYEDKLLPLAKLYSLESAFDTALREKIWLNSGGFLVIQQTEAFVSIDVNSGKYTGKKKMEETYRKINLEAAAEIARQLRLRNLSGIILIDFINMENPDHQDELFHVLKKLVKKDPVLCNVVDITPLNILEMTRKKVRRPLFEEISGMQE